MSEPVFIPPIRFSVIKAVGTGQLHALDVVVYQYLLAHTDSWIIREADIAEQLGSTPRTVSRSLRRLKDAGLILDGGFDFQTKRRRPPKLSRLGQYERPRPNDTSGDGFVAGTVDPSPKPIDTSGETTDQQTYQDLSNVMSGDGSGPENPSPEAEGAHAAGGGLDLKDVDGSSAPGDLSPKASELRIQAPPRRDRLSKPPVCTIDDCGTYMPEEAGWLDAHIAERHPDYLDRWNAIQSEIAGKSTKPTVYVRGAAR